MKYILIAITLILVACESSEHKIIKGLEDLQKETQYNLQTCQSQLDMYRNQGQPTYVDSTETTEPEEKSCSTYYTHPTWVDSKYVASCREVEESACGISLSGCDDDASYSCLKNVKYKTEIKEDCN